MTYHQFKVINDNSKVYFEKIGRITDVDFDSETCTLVVGDNETPRLGIRELVEDIAVNGLGVISNPSALSRWSGFSSIPRGAR